MELWLGWSSSSISALCELHHRGSQQGVHTDSWEICTGVQLDHDERKNTHIAAKYTTLWRITLQTRRLQKEIRLKFIYTNPKEGK